MRFSTAIVAIAAGAVSAYEYNAEYPAPDTTVYSTEVVTVTSCAAYVTDCPAESTVVTSTVYAVTTSSAEAHYPGTSSAAVVPYPSKYYNSSSVAVPTYPPKGYPVASSSVSAEYPGGGYPPVKSTGAHGPYPPAHVTSSEAAACPTYSVKTVVEDVTTVVKTTKYETVAVPCPTGGAATPSGYPVPAPVPGGNSTGTYPAPPPAYTAGASTMGASVILAAAAGLAALLL